MKLLIVYATPGELSLPGEAKETGRNERIRQFVYRDNLEISVLTTGAGMISTVYHLQRELAKNKYDLVINAGLAGCFHKEVALGSVFLVTEDCFSEMGAEDGEEFISMVKLGLQDPDDPPFRNGQLINDKSSGIQTIEMLSKAKAITINKVHGNSAEIEKVKDLFNADLESMEGAAFFYVCLSEKIPCIQIRAVSNLIEKRNKKSWNIPLALRNLQSETKKMLDELAEK